jgi:hypothetical protein
MEPIQVNHQVFFTGTADRPEGSVQLVHVEDAVLDATKTAVAQEVILLVGVERPGDNLSQNRPIEAGSEKSDDVVPYRLRQQFTQVWIGSDYFRRDDFVDLFLFLVLLQGRAIGKPGEGRFRNVAERPVSNIVEQGSDFKQIPVGTFNAQLGGHQPGNMGDAQRVIEPGM